MSTHSERIAELQAAITTSGKGWRLETGSSDNPVYATRRLRSGRMALICGHTTGEWSAGFQTETFRTVTTAAAAIKIMDDYENSLP